MKSSGFFKLNGQDFLKGLIVAVGTAVLTSLVQILETQALPNAAQLKSIGIMAAAAAAGYLLKNLFTNNQGETFKTDTVEPKEGE